MTCTCVLYRTYCGFNKYTLYNNIIPNVTSLSEGEH